MRRSPRSTASAARPTRDESADAEPSAATPAALDRATLEALYRQARTAARRQADVDDLVQETLLAGWRAGRADLPWLAGVLRRQASLQARTALRRRRRESEAGADIAGVGTPSPATAGPVRAPDWLRRLPPSARRVAVLALHGLGADEIRWLLGISPAAFRQRLTVIRRSLATLDAEARGEGIALAYLRDPRRSAELQFGLVRRALRAAMRGDGLGTHDADGHLLVLRVRAHVPAPRGNG